MMRGPFGMGVREASVDSRLKTPEQWADECGFPHVEPYESRGIIVVPDMQREKVIDLVKRVRAEVWLLAREARK